MSRYLEILSVDRPFPFNVDGQNRVMFSVNFEAQAAAAVSDWEKELAQAIVDAGLGTLGTDIFIGPLADVPTGTGPYTQIQDTGGETPNETHNGDEYENLSAQIVVRGTSFSTTRTRALAIWRELHGKRNVTITAA